MGTHENSTEAREAFIKVVIEEHEAEGDSVSRGRAEDIADSFLDKLWAAGFKLKELTHKERK